MVKKLALAAAIASLAVGVKLVVPKPGEVEDLIEAEVKKAGEPPRRLRLHHENRHFCRLIGVRFNGMNRPGDVVAYDVDDEWIELAGGRRLVGIVEPYWRPKPEPALAAARHNDAAAIAAAEAKRARKAARQLRNEAKGKGRAE